MKLLVSAIALLLVVASIPSTAAIAQAQKTSPPKPAESPPAAPTSPAPPPVKIRRTEITAVDNWTVTCTETDQPNAKRNCSAELKITQADNNVQRVVFTWLIGNQDGKPISVLSMPPGVLIGPGVQISVGGKEVKKVSYSLCQTDHCEAVVPMDDAVIKDLSGAETSDVSVYAANGNGVKFTVNLKGFKQAIADIGK